MIEVLKEVTLDKLSGEITEYNNYLDQLKEMENKIKEDNSENEYLNSIKELKKKYKMKRFFKEKDSYEKELKDLNESYNKNLTDFASFYKDYRNLKLKLSKWDIYRIKRRMEDIPRYDNLKNFKLTQDEVVDILKDKGIYNKLTKEELQEISKLPNKKK